MADKQQKKANPMRKVILEKVTLNIGTGESGQKLENAKKLMEKLTNKKVIITKTHNRTTFGMAKGRPIGVKVTLRGNDAAGFLKSAFHALGNKLEGKKFDSTGNFSFGVEEYISLPLIKYDPEIGILGFDVAVTLTRPGYKIAKRKIKPKKIGGSHKITKDEAMDFVKKEWGVKIE